MREGDERPDDGELMARFYGCEEVAFNLLAEGWWSRLFGFFRKMGFGAEEAEDLAQDTLVRLYLTKEKRSFSLGQRLEPYLFTAARNLAIEHWRHRQPPARATSPLEEEELEPGAAGLPASLLEDLFLCIWSLPETEQTYILLCGRHGLGDLTHGEIGQVMGKWPAQVTHLSQGALARLRDCMENKGYR